MAVTGGICFLAIGGINEVLDYEMPFLLQMLYGAIAVTATEFIFGCVLNLWLKLDIWDYSNLPGNILGADLSAVYRPMVFCFRDRNSLVG